MSQKWNEIKQMAFIRQSFKLWSKDWFLKAISLWIAVVLWLFVGGEDSIEKTIRIPVEIINLPRELVISNQYKREIEVSVTGPRSVILNMDEQKISHQVDLSAATPGTLVVENDHDHITVPRSVTVQRVQPSSIILSIDKLVQKSFPVIPNTVGSVAPGFEVKTIRMNPDFVTITGPATILEKIEELQTRYISLNGLNKSEQLQVPLELSRELVDLIGETSVTADIEVGPVVLKKTVKNVPVEFALHGQTASINPKTVTVTALFPQLLLEKVKSPAELLIAKAVPNEAGDGFKVAVTTRDKPDLPIEVVRIVPPTVELIADSAAAVMETSEEVLSAEDSVVPVVEVKEVIGTEGIPESEIGGVPKLKADNLKKKYRLE